MLGVVFATFSLRRELPDMILGDEPLLSQGSYVTHCPAQPPLSWAGVAAARPPLHRAGAAIASSSSAHRCSLFRAATLQLPSCRWLHRPRRRPPASTAPDARNLGDPGDRPSIDPTLRPSLLALVALVGHLFTPRPPPFADLDAVVNSGKVSIFSNFVFWIWNMNVRMNCFDLNVRRKLI
jgi:hypothetical protein